MFASSDFGIAQSLCIGLDYLISFGKVSWHSYNIPMGRRTIKI
jgi:hypothetical protein